MEHIVLSHMWKHLNRNNIILPDQHGLSCETQLVEAVHDWAASMNKRHQTDLILLDFSKAFDCVPHQRLLHKLNYVLWNLRTHTLLGKIVPVRPNTACINKWFSFCSGKCHIWCAPRLSPWSCTLSSIHK